MAYEFQCKDAGAISCGARITADSEEDMRRKLAEHVRDKHGVDDLNETLADHLLAVTKKES